MQIMHVNLVMGYTEGLNYQENCLCKCHAQAGHQVTELTTQYCYTQGEWGPCQTSYDYVNDLGVHVIRLPFLLPLPYSINKHIGLFKGTYKVLEQERPDVICIHNFHFQDVRTFARYKKAHPEVRIYVDNHIDYSIGAQTWISEHIMHRIVWASCAHAIASYTERFYGVMPSRVDFLTNIYGLDPAQCELLVMGADDDAVAAAREPAMRRSIREQYGIGEDDFLIVTGGKIDLAKTQTILLMRAVQNIADPRVRLLVFGSVVEELQGQVNGLADGHKVQYIGWMQSEQSYNVFGAADLVVFPGRHSVYWEQVVGLGIPMLVKDWPGTHHVDLGGNVRFLTQDSVEEIQGAIQDIIDHPDQYQQMKHVAETKGMQTFSYNEIAKRSIGE